MQNIHRSKPEDKATGRFNVLICLRAQHPGGRSDIITGWIEGLELSCAGLNNAR